MIVDKIALILVIVGALNWGGVGLFGFDTVAFLFGGQAAVLSRIVYALVGLAGLWCVTLLFRDTEEYGCILSEFAPGTPPAKWTFPKRNRIISGLSCGVLVVEAPEKSGALITARLAAEQGRDVFAGPGNIDQPSFVGSNRLLRDGAIMVSSGWDVLSEYEALFPDKIRKEDAPAHQTAYPDEVRKAAEAENRC